MSHDDEPPARRRRFLAQGAAVAAALLAGGQARSDEAAPPGSPDWMKAPGADVGSQTCGLPSRFEAGVIRTVPKGLPQYISASSRTPLQDLDGILTPNGLFYERHHGGIPDIDPARHRLMIHGLVDRPLAAPYSRRNARHATAPGVKVGPGNGSSADRAPSPRRSRSRPPAAPAPTRRPCSTISAARCR